MGDNNLLDLINQELRLYRQLVTEQKEKIHLYLKGDLDRVKTSMERDKRVLEEIRAVNIQLSSEMGGRALSEIAAEMEASEGSTLKAKIEELRRLTSELSRVNLQNYRYTQSCFGFTRAVLGQIFSENVNYNQNGNLQTGQTVVEF
jgi:hypothetical protein